MYCQKCEQRPATVHITHFINGKKQETHLCEICAQEEQISIGIPQIAFNTFNDFLGSFFTQPAVTDKKINVEACPACRTPYHKIAERGRVGCSECYRHFSLQLDPLIKKVHGNNTHTGKIPKRMGESFRLKRELEELKEKLKSAVEREEYEKAAGIRDRIKELEKEMDGGEVSHD
ncbi:MAG: UvrB/UvrC motif-containing protein [Bacillota bacterium]|uniref:UVR domain-containing protein n=1 Tax=Thermanaerosceptrum fracticalcis TaxID=1712410 RepID=A0A7G6E5R1_THEFR|nr:UvrB/UvrC motif-containing protein [Thermanaerosceptrum fracticalcis]QNB47415.1 hypothetical protein BR63_14640 [Thermanaerosceptrum fracticalcis]